MFDKGKTQEQRRKHWKECCYLRNPSPLALRDTRLSGAPQLEDGEYVDIGDVDDIDDIDDVDDVDENYRVIILK